MIVLPIHIRDVMIMALMLAIAIAHTRLAASDHLYETQNANNTCVQGIDVLPRKALPCRPESSTRNVASGDDGNA